MRARRGRSDKRAITDEKRGRRTTDVRRPRFSANSSGLRRTSCRRERVLIAAPSQRAEKPEVTIYNRPHLPPSGHSFDDGRTASAAEGYSGPSASGTLAGDDFRSRSRTSSILTINQQNNIQSQISSDYEKPLRRDIFPRHSTPSATETQPPHVVRRPDGFGAGKKPDGFPSHRNGIVLLFETSRKIFLKFLNNSYICKRMNRLHEYA